MLLIGSSGIICGNACPAKVSKALDRFRRQEGGDLDWGSAQLKDFKFVLMCAIIVGVLSFLQPRRGKAATTSISEFSPSPLVFSLILPHP